MKNILKEIFIFVLIILAIILVLGVLLYDYIPTSKVVPTGIEYKTPENLKEEIEEELIENTSQIIISYEIDKEDLNVYQANSNYVPGKINPFTENGRTTTSTSTPETDGGNGTETKNEEEIFNNNKTK